MRYETRGVSPNRKFVVQFTVVPYRYHSELNTFQYVLYEGSNDIQVNYLNVTSYGRQETAAGIENANGTIGLQYPGMDKLGNYRDFYVRYSTNQSGPAIPPIAVTGEATGVTADSVILNGTVNPNGVKTSSYFEYGTSTGYGFTTVITNKGSGTENVSAAAAIADLAPETEYHYRLVAVNSAGTSYGDDRTFTTSSSFSSNFLYFPNITSNADGWETEICVINTTDKLLNGVFRAYNDDGELIDEIDYVTLNPKGRIKITVGDEFSDPAAVGYIIFEPDSGPVSGYMKFYVEGYYRASLPAIAEINTGDIFASHIASTENWWTKISLLNTTPWQKELEIEFDNGETIPLVLAANEHRAFLIRDLFEGEPRTDIHSALIRDAGGVVGLVLFNEADSKMSGVLLSGETSSDMFFPHIAAKDGWNTGIVIYNPEGFGSAVVITPYDSKGKAYKDIRFTLKGREHFARFTSDPDLEIPEDAAWLKIYSTVPVTGFELFSKTDLLAGYTGVGISGKEGIFPKLEDDGVTGLAVVNLGESEASILLTAYDDEGNVIATATVSLASHARVVSMAPKLFSQDISSATYITYSSNMDVVGFQLNASSDGMMLDALPGM